MNDETIFSEALELDEGLGRDEFLQRACGDDEQKLQRIQDLLASHEQSNSLLDQGLDPKQFAASTMDAKGSIGPAEHEQIGRYRLLHLLGEGGMGSVYMAEQQQPVRRRVAVKIIKQGMNTDQFIARFEAERQALAMMDHPNIAKVLDAGCTDEGRPYFVMELVKGIPITDFCDQNKLRTEERLGLFIQVCNAVQHAHQKGVIHRDLKPSNVMVAMYDDRPVPKVIDFGVAKATHQPLTEQTLYTVPGQIVGTWEYMSPEQAILNQLDVDTRTDIYSLGVILYELLTGETPLDLKSLRPEALEERLRRIREQEPSRPSLKVSSLGERAGSLATYRNTEANSLAQSLRGDLDWIVMKAIEKDRSRRYETANSFAAEIQRYLNDEPISFRPPSNWEQFGRLYRRHRAVVTTSCLTMCGLALGLIVAFWQYTIASKRAADLEIKETHLQARNDQLNQTLESLERQRRNAENRLGVVKDYTMLLARSGVPRDLELALRAADAVGATEVWKLMLQAQASMEGGETAQAVDILRRAMVHDHDPDFLAAKGMLATALLVNGETDEHLRLHRELESLPLTTPEEFLFVGNGLRFETQRWLETANRALELRESTLAHLNRASASMSAAIDQGNLSLVEQGIKDLERVQKSSVETPYLIALRVQLLLTAMILAENHSPPISPERWRTQAEIDIASLEKSYPSYGWGLIVSAWYKDKFLPEQADAAWTAVLNRGSGGWHSFHAAAMILRNDSLDQWRHKLNGPVLLERTALGCLMALQGGNLRSTALEIYRSSIDAIELVNTKAGFGIEIALCAKATQLVKQDATKLLQNAEFLTRFDLELVSYLAEKKNLEEFSSYLKSCPRTEQLMGHFLIGLKAYAEDKPELAIEHFRKTRETGVYHTSDYYWARAMLQRLDEKGEAAQSLGR